MGGKNIILVMDDANLDLAWTAQTSEGGFGSYGPALHGGEPASASIKGVYKELRRAFLSSGAARLKVGNGLDPAVEMGPCINEQQLQTVMSYVEIGVKEGAKLLTGGHRLASGALAPKVGFHEPTVFGDWPTEDARGAGRNFWPRRFLNPR